jgi:hypothetical protein
MFHFWQGEDKLIRGIPQDEENSQWFNYNLEIEIKLASDQSGVGEDVWFARVIRIPATRSLRKIAKGNVIKRVKVLSRLLNNGGWRKGESG